MSTEPAGFIQSGWNVRGDVINVNGDLILSKHGSADDFVGAIESLGAELAEMEDVPADEREGLQRELDLVATEAKAGQPSKDAIVTRLSSVKARLDGLGGVASGALNLAKTVASIAAWAAQFF